MAHEVKILPGKSFRISPNVCPPYNADFDGDEMNLHVAQNEEARAEAELLMKVEDQIISPRHGHALISPTQDYVSGVYMLTKKDSIFNKKEACDMLALCGIYNLPKPDGKLEDGCKGYSGKLLISQLLPKGFNLEERTKLCKCEKCPKEKCPTEGYILIKDGQLIAGALEKKTFSQEIIEALVSNYSPKIAREFIDNAARMISYVITTRGFSVSLDSHVTSIEVSKKIDEIAERADKEVNGLVMQYKNKTLERAPGRTLRETLEQKIMLTLGKARNQVGDVLEKEFSIENSAIMMARTGARGSMLNVTLMSGIIGQQSVRDKRLKRGFRKRVLSCFKRGDIGAKPRGYISSNFMKGLNPAEFFFHSMGGRDSMVNTAIRTARSGYMQRRFIHALQDLSIHPDGSVRDASGLIIETKYGGDGLDPMTIRKIKEEFELPEME